MTYRESVLRNIAPHLTDEQRLSMGVIGLCGEAGEVADLVKKHLFHKVDLNRDKLLKELSDVRWYFELLCHLAGTSIEEIERINMAKLMARYPNGFSTQDSIEKKDESQAGSKA